MARHARAPAQTDPRYGRRLSERNLREHIERGVVLLDKPAGMSSRSAAEVAARLLGVERFGHGGTLDPAVTGVLPVLLGRSTPAAAALLGCDKSYVGTMLLHDDVQNERLKQAMEQFVGLIEQLPPRRSRVRRRPRRRTVHAFRVTARNGRQVQFEVDCQGGTYVRKLVHDLGQALGCGAHMAALRRTRSGPFGLEDCVTVAELRAAVSAADAGDEAPLRRAVRSVEQVLCRLMPVVVIDDGAVRSVCTGYPLAVRGVCELDDFQRGRRVALLTLKGELVALGRALLDTEQILAAEHGFAVKVERVTMDQDIYPKWQRPAGQDPG